MGGRLSRRGLFAGAAAAAAGSVIGLEPPAASPKPVRRSLRIAYVTDVHLDTKPVPIHGFAQCLRKIRDLNEQPDLIIQGGDIIMDGLLRDGDSVENQYALASDMLKRYTSLPIEHVIGNHDVWGWSRQDKNSLVNDPRYGKGKWLDWTGYSSTYRSFDRNGWHFVLLDSIMPEGYGYMAKLDRDQAAWLEQDLHAVSPVTPVCLVTHAPIISAGAMFFDPCERSGHWHVPRSLLHIDARWIKNVLVRHRNVKVCLSGHIHMQDRVEYNGVTHIGMGAVCGAWWRGPMQETPPQFGLVDFYDDGTSRTTFIRC